MMSLTGQNSCYLFLGRFAVCVWSKAEPRLRTFCQSSPLWLQRHAVHERVLARAVRRSALDSDLFGFQEIFWALTINWFTTQRLCCLIFGTDTVGLALFLGTNSPKKCTSSPTKSMRNVSVCLSISVESRSRLLHIFHRVSTATSSWWAFSTNFMGRKHPIFLTCIFKLLLSLKPPNEEITELDTFLDIVTATQRTLLSLLNCDENVSWHSVVFWNRALCVCLNYQNW